MNKFFDQMKTENYDFQRCVVLVRKKSHPGKITLRSLEQNIRLKLDKRKIRLFSIQAVTALNEAIEHKVVNYDDTMYGLR